MNGRHRVLGTVAAIMTACAVFIATAAHSAAPTPSNVHFSAAGTVGLPGLGLSLAWSPSGDALAAGGHFRDPVSHQRYDTRTIDVRGMRLAKSFDCHYFWTISQAWQRNPYIGEVIADGGGDHAVKIWSANANGSHRCNPGQFLSSDGAVEKLSEINGWVTSLAFSPDGRYLAGTSRDRSVRVWQIMPGTNQWKVVKLWYDKAGGNYLSVRWSPDGKRLVVGDRKGRVAELAFSLWDEATIDAFTKVHWQGQPSWFSKHRAQLAPNALWMETGHKQVWNARYSPDGNRVVAAGADGTLTVFAAHTGHVLYRVHAPANTALHGLDWSPDGALIAAGGADHVIYVYNASDGSLYDRLVGHKNVVSALAWSPDGRTLASTAGGPRLSFTLTNVVKGPDNAVHLWTRR
jgi:WD40 repeat protein